jgi:hypothetical protein
MTVTQRRCVRRYLASKTRNRRKPIDGEKIACEICNSRNNLEWHHIKAWSEGGDDSPDNLQVLCHCCHLDLHQGRNDFRRAGQWGGLVSAYIREQTIGRDAFCETMRKLAQRRWAA